MSSVLCVPDACTGQKRASDALELELTMVVGCCVVLGPVEEQQVLLAAETPLLSYHFHS